MSAIDHYLSRPWLTHYPAAVPADRRGSAAARCPRSSTRRPSATPAAPRWCSTAGPITYRELRDATDRLACALARLGVKKGDRVALYLVNSPQFIIAYFAALKCGATVTPISPVYTSHEVRYQLRGQRRARGRSARTSLYEKVDEAGVALDLVVVTNVGEYLPALKRMFAKKFEVRAGGKVHSLQAC